MGTVVCLICLGFLLPVGAIYRALRKVPAAAELLAVVWVLAGAAVWGLSRM